MGSHHGAVSGGRRHGFVSRVGFNGFASKADVTGPHYEAASRAGVTESYHGPTSWVRITDRRHGSASRDGIRGRRHGLNHRQASQVRITSRRHQGSAPWTARTGPHHGPHHGYNVTGSAAPTSRSHRYLRAGAEATEAGTGAGDRVSCRNVVSNQPLQSSNSNSSPPSVDPAWWYQYRLL